MIDIKYDNLISKIAKQSKLSVDEIQRRVEAKIAKLSNLISREGAAQVVAAELGIFFDEKKVKIDELLSGMRKISVSGKIIKVFPIRVFKTQTGEGKVASLLIGDETGNVRCVLWDTNHIALIEQEKLKEGNVIEVKNASVRGEDVKELHLGSNSEIKESSEKIENVVETESLSIKKISSLQPNERAMLRAVVVQAFEPRFFFVCPECNSKAVQENNQYVCSKHSAIVPKERALFSMVIDDGSLNIRAVCFSETIEKLFNCTIEDLKSVDLFMKKKDEILGEEMLFTGRIRQNRQFDRTEFIVQSIDKVDVDAVIKELSKKSL